MSKELEAEKLPPSYINLGFDATPVSGPSAPSSSEEHGDYAASSEPVAGPSAPKEEESDKYAASSGPGPTPTAPTIQETPQPTYLKYSFPPMPFEEVYEACVKYVDDHCCYSSRFVRQMKLTDINNGSAFYYKLETFGEKRESTNRYESYRGGRIDGPENGRPPNPWDMYVPMPVMFVDSSARIDIPHTDEVTTCDKCRGRGEVRCSSCGGSGDERCWSCSGSGRNSDDERCSSCSGSGRNRCTWCSGSGRVECSKCDGYGKIKRCRVLLVTWKNHITDFASGIYKLPMDNIRKTAGDVLFTEQYPKLLPIVNAPDISVNVESTRMIEAHKISFPSELIKRQRHTLRALPFVRVQYEWKETTGEFYIYGKDRHVYFEDYPQQCCCCICC